MTPTRDDYDYEYDSVTTMNKEAVSGATAGFVATITLHPLDVIKTRLQVQDLSKTYDGTVHAFKTILKREGARGLYAGLTPAVVGNTASWAMYFALYDRARKRYEKRGTSSRNGEGGGDSGRGVVGGGNDDHDDDDDNDGASKKSISSGETLLAAAEEGIGVSLLTNPIWVAKTRLALQERGGGAEAAPKAGGAGVNVQKPTKATVRYKGLIDCLYSIARNEGVSGLYKGLTPSLLLVSHGAIQFTCYENLKSLARGGVISAASIGDSNGGGEMNNDVIDTTREQQQQQLQQRELTSAECGVYGMLSKIVASLVTYPQQVVRARMQKLQIERNQIKYKTLLQSFATISRREGISGMYKGMVPNLARMLPSTGVTFFTYEFVNRMFENDESTDSG